MYLLFHESNIWCKKHREKNGLNSLFFRRLQMFREFWVSVCLHVFSGCRAHAPSHLDLSEMKSFFLYSKGNPEGFQGLLLQQEDFSSRDKTWFLDGGVIFCAKVVNIFSFIFSKITIVIVVLFLISSPNVFISMNLKIKIKSFFFMILVNV